MAYGKGVTFEEKEWYGKDKALLTLHCQAFHFRAKVSIAYSYSCLQIGDK